MSRRFESGHPVKMAIAAEFDTYTLNVQIYKDENGAWSYGICQEFEDYDESEFQVLESGSSDDLQTTVELAADGVKRLFI